MLTRRSALLGTSALALLALPGRGFAAEQVVKIGIDCPLTGADAQSATADQERRDDGDRRGERAQAVSAATRSRSMVLDDGTATAGPVRSGAGRDQRPQDGRRPSVVAAVGPQMSGAGKAMSPILQPGQPRDHHAVLDQPRHHRPEIRRRSTGRRGKAIYFRTVTTDAYQGPNMANYMRRHAEGEVGLRARRHRRLRRRASPTRSRRRPRRCGIKVLGPRPARPEGGRLHDDADQDQGAQSRCALLRRRRRRPASSWSSRPTTSCPTIDQGRRRRRVRRRHADRRRLPGGRGLVRDQRLAARDRTIRDGRLGRRASAKNYNMTPERLLDHRLRRGAGHHRRDQARRGERQGGQPRRRCATRSRPRRSRRCRARSRSTRTATSTTR